MQSGAAHVLFRLGDRVRAEMEDRGCQHRGGMAVANALDEMIERADTADLSTLLDVIALKLSDALPGHTRVERTAWPRRRVRSVSK